MLCVTSGVFRGERGQVVVDNDSETGYLGFIVPIEVAAPGLRSVGQRRSDADCFTEEARGLS